MGTILLVRHGQASFGAIQYDQLSELGKHQADVLGRCLADRGIRPAVMVTGSLARQRATAEHLQRAAGWSTVADIDPGWDEYDHEDVLAGFDPRLRDGATLNARLAEHAHPRRAFQAMFVQASSRWAEGRHDGNYAETFGGFTTRVTDSLGRVASSLGQGETAIVVSSGGPMSWVAAQLLTAPIRPAGAASANEATASPLSAPTRNAWLNLSGVVVNTAVTTVLVGSGLTLLSVNDHSHLLGADTPDRTLVTYR